MALSPGKITAFLHMLEEGFETEHGFFLALAGNQESKLAQMSSPDLQSGDAGPVVKTNPGTPVPSPGGTGAPLPPPPSAHLFMVW